MDWLKNKLEDYSKIQKQADEKQKSEMLVKKETGKKNILLGQKVLKEIVLQNLNEIKKYFDEYGINCQIMQSKAHIENLNMDVVGKVEVLVFTKNIPKPSFIKFIPLLDVPKFQCEIYTNKNNVEKTDSLNYDNLTAQTFETFIRKFVDEIL